MIFDFFRNHHRKELLAEPFPAEWEAILEQNVAHYAFLIEEERKRLRDHLRIFLEEKNWEGCGGVEITDEIKVTVSAQACLLLLNLEHDYYHNVESILVYPSAYTASGQNIGPGGIIEEGSISRLGEAWSNGPVILSWFDAKSGGLNPMDGHNVVLHEFAHKLDGGEGGVDGVPHLTSEGEYELWAEVMSKEYQRLVELAEHGKATLLDHYGATNAGEFFAVATECFFEKARQMREHYSELYSLMKQYYRQDTAARMDAWKEREIQSSAERENVSHRKPVSY